MTKAIENMQSAVETESKAKAEALRMKKKLETDVLDLESNLERANAANADTQRTIKSYQLNLREARTLLEQADRFRRMVEQELQDTNESLSDSTCTNQAIQGAKMKLESEMQTLQADCDEMAGEASLSEEKAQTNALKGGKKAMTRMDTRIRELESEMDAENR